MSKSKIPPISIETNVYHRLQLMSEREGISVSQKIRNLVYNHVKNTKKVDKIVKEQLNKYGFVSEVNDKSKLPLDSTNYKEFLYGNHSSFEKKIKIKKNDNN